MDMPFCNAPRMKKKRKLKKGHLPSFDFFTLFIVRKELPIKAVDTAMFKKVTTDST